MKDSMVSQPLPLQAAGLATPGGHYRHAVAANGFVFISGQLLIAAHGIEVGRCNGCGRSWRPIYTVTDIAEDPHLTGFYDAICA